MLDVAKILEELKQEKEQLEQAIITLERLIQGRAPRRGRPPSWMTTEGATPKRRGRPPGSKNKTTAATNSSTAAPKDSAVA